MNYSDYRKKVEEMVSALDAKKKEEILIAYLQAVPEKKREEILQRLQGEEASVDVKDKLREFEQWCARVEEGQLRFEVYGYEPYEEYSNEDGGGEEYLDPLNIRGTYEEFFELSMGLFDACQYQEALLFLEPLLHMQFIAYSEEYDEYLDVSVGLLFEEKILRMDYRNALLRLMYLYCQICQGQERARQVYTCLNANRYYEIQLEEIFTAGPEKLDGFEAFLLELMEYLQGAPEEGGAELLAESALLFGGPDYLWTVAENSEKILPEMYLHSCRAYLNSEELEEAERTGLLAMDRLPKNLSLRSEIADMVLIAAKILNHEEVVRHCLLESFYASTTAFGFLRLCEVAKDQEILSKAAHYAEEYQERSDAPLETYSGQWRENHIDEREKEAIRFLSGKWQELYERYKNTPDSLGWSRAPKGVVIPLYLVALHEGETLNTAGLKLFQEVCRKLGTYTISEEWNNRLYQSWKKFYSLSEEESSTYLSWVAEEVDKRVEGIVGSSYRNSYGKAALLVAVLGEVMESRGEPSGKKKLIEFYKKKYNRRSAFRKELDQYLPSK